MVRDGEWLPEDDPLHNFTTRWGGQRTCVPVIAAQGCRQEVPEDERIQKGLLLCLGEEGKEKHNGKSYRAADTGKNPLHAGATSQALCLFTSLEVLAFGGGRATENKACFPGCVLRHQHCTVFHEKQVP